MMGTKMVGTLSSRQKRVTLIKHILTVIFSYVIIQKKDEKNTNREHQKCLYL